MPKVGKRFKVASEKFDKSRLHDVSEAMELITETATAKFDETIEAVSYTHL